MGHGIAPPTGFTWLASLGPRLARLADADGNACFLKRLTPRMRDEPLARVQLATEIAALRVLPAHVGAAFVTSGEDEAGPYLVERFLEGQDLEALVLREGALPEGRVRGLYDSALACLERLHGAHDERGALQLVHGDVSPGNLFVLPSGAVRLVDFELGSLRDHAPPGDGSFRGTLHYASPPVVRGADPGPRDDHFALAASMLFALRGAPPRDQRGPQLVLAAGEAPPPVPALQDAALQRAQGLALEPHAR